MHVPPDSTPSCPCPAVMYLHPICVAGHDNKLAILKRQGFFFLDDDEEHGELSMPCRCCQIFSTQCLADCVHLVSVERTPAYSPPSHHPTPSRSAGGCQPRAASGDVGAGDVPVCRPLHWRQPLAEMRHYRCPNNNALVHGDLPHAVTALLSGAVTGAEAGRLLAECV